VAYVTAWNGVEYLALDEAESKALITVVAEEFAP
jgi:hypothetical protein